MISLNNKIITKVSDYNKKITSTITGGFARIDQKHNLISLTVLVDSTLNLEGKITGLNKNDTIYILEEVFMQPHVRKVYGCSALKEEFHIIEGRDVCLVQSVLNTMKTS